MGKGITETLNWFYNLVLFYTCGRLCALRLYNSLCFYTTGRFYASTMLLYADCQFCFRPLYVSTHLRFYGSLCFLHHCTILRIYDPTVRRLSVLFYTNVRLFACTLLRLSLLLHDWTILRIYDATVRRLAVLFYTTVRFYASTFLRLTLHRNSVLNRNPG